MSLQALLLPAGSPGCGLGLTWEADFLGLKPSFLGEQVGETVLPEEAEPFPLSVNQEKGMNGDTDERLEPSISSLGEEPGLVSGGSCSGREPL